MTGQRWARRVGSLTLGLALAACSGAVDGSGGEGDDGTTPGGGPAAGKPPTKPGSGPPGTEPGPAKPSEPPAPVDIPPAATAPAGPRPLRRLNKTEYANTLRDLLRLPATPFVNYPDDGQGESGFPSADRFEDSFARSFQESAEEIAATTVPRMKTLHPCTEADAACARAFAQGFGRRAFRRPLDAAEIDRLVGVYDGARQKLGLAHDAALGVVLEALLQSPYFLYHWELGPVIARASADKVVALNNHELAARLSYFYWASMPDDVLFMEADAKRLAGNPEALRAQARRLLADPRAKSRFVDFHLHWLHIDDIDQVKKNTAAYPWHEYHVYSVVKETPMFLEDLFGGTGDFKYATLMTAPYSFVSWRLGESYLPKDKQLPRTDEFLRKTELPAGQRAGVLTQIPFLAKHAATNASNPAKRGKEVVERVLCRDIPPPDPNIPPVEEPSKGKTTRERFEAHLKADACRGCHQIIDPAGFAFEIYDGVGRYRTTEGDRPVNAAGTITLDGAQKPFANAVELIGLIAGSAEGRSCYARQWFRYGMRRQPTAADEASLKAATDAFAKAGTDVRTLLSELAATPSFQFRAAAAGEMTEVTK